MVGGKTLTGYNIFLPRGLSCEKGILLVVHYCMDRAQRMLQIKKKKLEHPMRNDFRIELL